MFGTIDGTLESGQPLSPLRIGELKLLLLAHKRQAGLSLPGFRATEMTEVRREKRRSPSWEVTGRIFTSSGL